VTSVERRMLVELVDEAVRRLIRGRKYCPLCTRWLLPDEFANGLCRSCDSIRVLDSRETRRAA
jgi:hypothetical protein